MAEAVVSAVVEGIGGLLVEEAKLLSGVREQAKELENELRLLQCLLKDADAKKRKDATVGHWIGEIRRLSYQAESILEEFSVERERGWVQLGAGSSTSKFKNFFESLAHLPSKCKAFHNAGSKIASIQKRITNLRASMQAYNIVATYEAAGESSSIVATMEREKWLRKTYGREEVKGYFVGREEDMKKLVSLVTDDESDAHVVSIWGMGGAGKTTLARKIYNHPSVRRLFKAFAWVCVTQECQPLSVWGDAFKQLIPSRSKEVESMGRDNLVSELVRLQEEEKCFVILDDIWSLDDWKIIGPAFVLSDSASSKVLLTTRTKQVAEVGIAYPLNCLGDEDGWELLRKIAFGTEAVKDAEEFAGVGIQVVRKCGGHPLAIRIAGGILRESRSLHEWKKLKQNMDLYLMGSSESTGDGYGEIRKVLGLSYDYLPYHLKPCLLYLASFPEDHDIDIVSLYAKWMAEGIISSNTQAREETKMEVAERYLGELANRSMVEVQIVDEKEVSRSGISRYKACRLHDLMREFVLAQAEEDGFLSAMDLRGVRTPNNMLSSCKSSYSRLALFFSDGRKHWREKEDTLPLEQLTISCNELRSLLLSSYDYYPFEKRVILSDLKMFKQIRVLELRGIMFDDSYRRNEFKLPKGIESLVHLRYVGLISCRIDELPSTLGSCPYLETLNLVKPAGPRRLLPAHWKCRLPNVLWKLKRLRHLWLAPERWSSFCVVPGGKLRLDGLDLLETLDGFDTLCMDLSDLPKLKNLRYLNAKIRGNEDLSVVIRHFTNNLNYLQEAHLHIWGCNFMSQQGSALLKQLLKCHKIHLIEFDTCQIDTFVQYTSLIRGVDF